MTLNKINKNMIDPNFVQEVQDTTNKIGNLNDLKTTNKTDIVKSVNEVTSQLAETAKQNFNQVQTLTMPTLYKNATESLNVTTYDGGKEAIHSSVVYIQEGINGYKFWMACTPYSFSNEYVENPCIYCSFDGINWVVPLAGVNPLSPAPQTTGEGGNWHNSDTFLLYRKDIKRLEVWWRKRVRAVGDPTAPEIILRRTSLDGKAWTPTEELFRYDNSPSGENALSPSAVYNEKTRTYTCFLIKSNFNVDTFTDLLRIYESDSNGKNWVLKKEFDPTFIDGREKLGWKIWHGEVRESTGGYEWVVTGGQGAGITTMELFHAYSNDGLTFSPLTPILKPSVSLVDDRYIYHGMLVKTDKEHIIYYTGRTSLSTTNWKLNRSVIDFTSIINKQTESASNVVALDSKTSNLEKELDALKTNTRFIGGYKVSDIESGAWSFSGGGGAVGSPITKIASLKNIRNINPLELPEGKKHKIYGINNANIRLGYFLADTNLKIVHNSGVLNTVDPSWQTNGHLIPQVAGAKFIVLSISKVDGTDITVEYFNIQKNLVIETILSTS